MRLGRERAPGNMAMDPAVLPEPDWHRSAGVQEPGFALRTSSTDRPVSAFLTRRGGGHWPRAMRDRSSFFFFFFFLLGRVALRQLSLPTSRANERNTPRPAECKPETERAANSLRAQACFSEGQSMWYYAMGERPAPSTTSRGLCSWCVLAEHVRGSYDRGEAKIKENKIK